MDFVSILAHSPKQSSRLGFFFSLCVCRCVCLHVLMVLTLPTLQATIELLYEICGSHKTLFHFQTFKVKYHRFFYFYVLIYFVKIYGLLKIM